MNGTSAKKANDFYHDDEGNDFYEQYDQDFAANMLDEGVDLDRFEENNMED